ncbi:hypothetical protein PENTCL1PPCAC_14535 [Pristionchus entomophagus]|uniref:Uncharacterized protein n=1 Tax=Pristionchus entomophagus TaxID=358040 RepID=A0AAV5T9V6_9BILA|nr:hypothetical protein PENTCL1PPCAC_14535 [Pristionchus entomophagus]
MPNTVDSDTNGEPTETSTTPPAATKSIIDTFKTHYRTFSIMRHTATAELQMRGVHMNPFEADLEEYEIVPCTYQIMNEATRIIIRDLFDFVPLVFPDFKDFSIADKWLLIRNSKRASTFSTRICARNDGVRRSPGILVRTLLQSLLTTSIYTSATVPTRRM